MKLVPFAAIALATGVITAADAIRVHLDGGYSAQSGSAACVARASFTYYHVGDTVFVAGTVGGAPSSGFRVTIVVKRCYRSGGVQTVKTVYARGRAGGSFKGSFQVQVPSDCYVQVHYLRVTSNRAYFRVR
jgi:hypothetical protein